MSVSGRLEDFSLKDILQIIAFSGRSGTLRVTADEAEARLLFKMGSLVRAEVPGGQADFGTIAIELGLTTDARVRQAAADQGEGASRRALGRVLLAQGDLKPADVEFVVKKQIARALRELLGWTSGEFVFEPHPVETPDSFGAGYAELMLEHGLSVQEILLQAVKFFDDRERLAPRAPSRGANPVVVLWHEEGLFRELLEKRLSQEAIEVDMVADGAAAGTRFRSHRAEGRLAVLLAEATEEGCAPELATDLAAAHQPTFVLWEPGTLGQNVEVEGTSTYIEKPERKAGEDEGFVRSIEALAVDIAFRVKALLPEEGVSRLGASEGSGDEALPPELSELLSLVRGEDAGALTLKLLEIVGKRFPRAVLMHVKGKTPEAGLAVKGAYGKTLRGTPAYDLLTGLVMSLDQAPGFVAAFETATPRCLRVGPDAGQIPDLIGNPKSGECLVIPVLARTRPVAIIYADTGETGDPIGDLSVYRTITTRVSRAVEEVLMKRKSTATPRV